MYLNPTPNNEETKTYQREIEDENDEKIAQEPNYSTIDNDEVTKDETDVNPSANDDVEYTMIPDERREKSIKYQEWYKKKQEELAKKDNEIRERKKEQIDNANKDLEIFHKKRNDKLEEVCFLYSTYMYTIYMLLFIYKYTSQVKKKIQEEDAKKQKESDDTVKDDNVWKEVGKYCDQQQDGGNTILGSPTNAKKTKNDRMRNLLLNLQNTNNAKMVSS